MSNKFLDVYPQLRQPQIGDIVKYNSPYFGNVLFEIKDIIQDIYILHYPNWPLFFATLDKIKIVKKS